MKAIYRGLRYDVVERTTTGMWIERPTSVGPATDRVHVSPADADLILAPTEEDLVLADAYERGEISAFEYIDGHTYPPNREIQKPRRHRTFQRH